MPLLRTRLAVGLVSLAVIGVELGLMRSLSLRYWHHFAYMVISVALAGFGASGTALTLMRRWTAGRERLWLAGLALAFAVSIPLMHWTGRQVPLDVPLLPWNLGQAGYVLVLEFLMMVPFFLAGSVIGLALMDRPARIGGHYAANLIGSGLGGAGAVLLMHVLRSDQLFIAMTAAAFLGGALALPWRRWGGPTAALMVALVIGLMVWLMPQGPVMSEYKMLPQVLAMPGTQVIYQTEGPLGRIDVVAGPAIHFAPGLSLQYTGPVPNHVLLISDGDATSAVYDCPKREAWAFLDYTTKAAPYDLRAGPAVLVIGAGGGSDIGLALYHQAARVTALEINADVISAMTGPLKDRGGAVYESPNVRVVRQEARGFLASSGEKFTLVQLPEIEAFGASGAGLYATQEAYLYTVESLAAMMDHLTADGILCITRWAQSPPREGLRVFDTAAEALRRRGADPARHLAMIRSWATVSVLAFKQPIGAEESQRLRAFCRKRSFDVCFLPDIRQGEDNRFDVLDRPYYYEGARALLGPDRRGFLAQYPFQVEATTDDRPYFFHAFRWHSLPVLWDQLGQRARAYLEVGYLMLIAALCQSMVLSVGLIVLPLLPGIRGIRAAKGKAAALGYFLAIGTGFMLLEMGFLQKLVLYLAHPIYSAAVVISAFLIFSGVGSLVSSHWPGSPRRTGALAAVAVMIVGGTCLAVLDGWLGLTQGSPAWVRFLVAGGTIAPLALAMGHLFPSGLRQLGVGSAALVPWAWAVNGFASVIATVAAPLLAMQFGFTRLALGAMACYALAGLLCRFLPEQRVDSEAGPL
jgi:hypothetical protein